MNIATNLDCAAFHFPDHCAIIEGDRSVSYSEFRQDANRIASALVDFFLWHLLEYPDLCFCHDAGSANDASSEESKPALSTHIETLPKPF